MSGGARTFAVWGALLLVTASALFAFRGVGAEPYALLFGAAAAVLAAALALIAWGHRRGDGEPPVRMVPDLSLASAGLGVALFLLALATVMGLWLALIGVGLALWSVAGLARERRAMRAERRGVPGARGGSARAERSVPGTPAEGGR